MRWVILAVLTGCAGSQVGPVKDGDNPATSEDSAEPVVFGTPTGCDPIDPSLCALPWPSTYFEARDETTATGWRLAVPDGSLPSNKEGTPYRAFDLNRFDGFSPMTPILSFFPNISLDGHLQLTNLGDFTQDDVLTVIVDAESGERIPHHAELDLSAQESQQLFVLRPAVPLTHGRRYVVGMRGLTTLDGSAIEPSDAFALLRSGDGGDDPDLDHRVADYENVVFPALEREGFAREELVLAWDFTVNSRSSGLSDAVSVRDQALAWWDQQGGDYVITEVEEADCSVPGTKIRRSISGTFTAPRFSENDEPGSVLARDSAGLPTLAGTTDAAFRVRIPCSVEAQPGAQLVQYGHGLLGSLSEVNTGHLQDFADDHGFVLFAMTWTGMSEVDVEQLIGMITGDLSEFRILPERSLQGFAEKLVGARFATDQLAADPAMQFGGEPAVDTSLKPVWYGISQGAIMGGSYVALSPDIERAVLGVGGSPYSLLLGRSRDFSTFLFVFQGMYPDHRDITLLIGAIQTLWDPAESGGYLQAGPLEPLEGTPSKNYLMQTGIGDAQVSNFGAHIQARAWNAFTVTPETNVVWGLEEREAPFAGSALVEWYYPDGSVNPLEAVPPEAEGDTHDCPRREPAAQLQAATFLKTGLITQTCDGVCEGVRAGFCD